MPLSQKAIASLDISSFEQLFCGDRSINLSLMRGIETQCVANINLENT